MNKPGDAIAQWARLNQQFAGLGTLPNGKPNLPTPNSLLAPAMAQYALNPQYAFDHEQTIWELHGCPGQFKDYFVRIYSGADPVAKDITFGAHDVENSPLHPSGAFKAGHHRWTVFKQAKDVYGYYNHLPHIERSVA